MKARYTRPTVLRLILLGMLAASPAWAEAVQVRPGCTTAAPASGGQPGTTLRTPSLLAWDRVGSPVRELA